MLYGRHPYINRRYSHPNTKGKYENERPSEEKQKVEIPLPNQSEVESSKVSKEGKEIARKSSFLDIIKNRIHLEEIILIGLILLFLKEGIEDELLIILLIYVLLG